VSKHKLLYGKASADLRLVPGDSAGVVTAFYVSE
jgi:xyloglucan:xyloglucosyl transferase